MLCLDVVVFSVFPIVTLTPNMTITVAAPRTVDMTCYAFGFPLPSVTWSRTLGSETVNVTLLSSSSPDYPNRRTVSTLTLNDASLSEAGDYTCLGDNRLEKDGVLVTDQSSSTSLQGTLTSCNAGIYRVVGFWCCMQYQPVFQAVHRLLKQCGAILWICSVMLLDTQHLTSNGSFVTKFFLKQ